jgi:hypothetical protein
VARFDVARFDVEELGYAPPLTTTTPEPVAMPNDDDAVRDEEPEGAVVAPAPVGDADAV